MNLNLNYMHADQVLLGLPSLGFAKGLESCFRVIEDEKKGNSAKKMAKLGAYTCKVMMFLTGLPLMIYSLAKTAFLMPFALFANEKLQAYVIKSFAISAAFLWSPLEETAQKVEETKKDLLKAFAC